MQRFAHKFLIYNYDDFYRPEKETFSPDLVSQVIFFVSPDMERLMTKEIEHATRLYYL